MLKSLWQYPHTNRLLWAIVSLDRLAKQGGEKGTQADRDILPLILDTPTAAYDDARLIGFNSLLLNGLVLYSNAPFLKADDGTCAFRCVDGLIDAEVYSVK